MDVFLKIDGEIVHEGNQAVVPFPESRGCGHVFGILSVSEILVPCPFRSELYPVVDFSERPYPAGLQGEAVVQRPVIDAHGIVPVTGRDKDGCGIGIRFIFLGYKIPFLPSVKGNGGCCGGIVCPGFRLSVIIHYRAFQFQIGNPFPA